MNKIVAYMLEGSKTWYTREELENKVCIPMDDFSYDSIETFLKKNPGWKTRTFWRLDDDEKFFLSRIGVKDENMSEFFRLSEKYDE